MKRRLLLTACIAAPLPLLAAIALGSPSWPWWLALNIATHCGLLWAVLHPRCQWLGPVMCDFSTEKKEVWLTLDDGPDGGRSLQLAGELHRRGVHATFFVIGERAAAQPTVIAALKAAGHAVANHTATHPRASFWRLGPAALRREIENGVPCHLFRAPVGHKPPALHAALGERTLVAWTVGGRDGWTRDASRLIRRVLSAARPGAIIMLHEDRPHSVETVLAVVDALIAAGFTFRSPAPA